MQNNCYFVNEITSLLDKGNHSFNILRFPKALGLVTHNVLIQR